MTLELFEAPALESGIVGVVDVVYPNDGVPFLKQKLGDLPADKTCAACH
jgi:hypothetical protein